MEDYSIARQTQGTNQANSLPPKWNGLLDRCEKIEQLRSAKFIGDVAVLVLHEDLIGLRIKNADQDAGDIALAGRHRDLSFAQRLSIRFEVCLRKDLINVFVPVPLFKDVFSIGEVFVP